MWNPNIPDRTLKFDGYAAPAFSDDSKVFIAVGRGETEVVLLEIQPKIAPGLCPVPEACEVLRAHAIIKTSILEACFEADSLALVRLISGLQRPVGIYTGGQRLIFIIGKGKREQEFDAVLVHCRIKKGRAGKFQLIVDLFLLIKNDTRSINSAS